MWHLLFKGFCGDVMSHEKQELCGSNSPSSKMATTFSVHTLYTCDTSLINGYTDLFTQFVDHLNYPRTMYQRKVDVDMLNAVTLFTRPAFSISTSTLR